jgi:molybdenum cofactor biosynthesis enzyme MoaA
MSGQLSDYEFSQIPFSQVVRVGQRSLLYNDLFCVSWLLGRYCNYHCSYCWPYARSDVKDHRPFAVIERTFNEIKRQARERGFNSFHFSFSGGEPTLHPDFLKIMSHYAADSANCRYQSVHMTTNLSQSHSWFAQFVQATRDLHRVSLTASYHQPFAKREVFARKLIELQAADVQVTINMVLSPERFADLWADALFFHQQDLNVTLKPQSDERAARVVEGYTAEQLHLLREGLPQREYTRRRLADLQKTSTRPHSADFKTLRSFAQDDGQVAQTMQVELNDSEGSTWYMDQAERFNAFHFNNFYGWECSAGLRSIIIREPGGVVKRSYSCADQALGTLDEGFTLFSELRPCISRSCLSSADSKIPKRKVGTRLPLWPGDAS